MSKLVKIGYDLDDVSIVQAPISPIRHRNECNPYRMIANKEMYPVIVSPMASVTNEHNYAGNFCVLEIGLEKNGCRGGRALHTDKHCHSGKGSTDCRGIFEEVLHCLEDVEFFRLFADGNGVFFYANGRRL